MNILILQLYMFFYFYFCGSVAVFLNSKNVTIFFSSKRMTLARNLFRGVKSKNFLVLFLTKNLEKKIKKQPTFLYFTLNKFSLGIQ